MPSAADQIQVAYLFFVFHLTNSTCREGMDGVSLYWGHHPFEAKKKCKTPGLQGMH